MKNKYPDSLNIEVIGKDSEGNDRIIVNPISYREALTYLRNDDWITIKKYNEFWKRRWNNENRNTRLG